MRYYNKNKHIVFGLVILITISSTLFTTCYSAFALPKGHQVEAGNASFDSPDASTLNITATDKTVINFSSFNISENETVNFFLPDGAASLLTRDIGTGVTEIIGRVNLNQGKWFHTNLNGIHIAPQALINVPTFVASTLDISTNNFVNGNYVFEHNSDQVYAQILNEGRITGRNIALLGSSVHNSGIIVAQMGKVQLSSGDKATVSFDRNGFIQVEINEKTSGKVLDANGNSIKDAVANPGTIEAGQVIMSAKTAGDIFENAVNHTGVIRATEMVEVDGVIKIISDSNVNVAGTLEAEDLADIYVDCPGTMTLTGIISTEEGAIKIGTVISPEKIAGTPSYIHTKGDFEIIAHSSDGTDQKIRVLETSRGDCLRYSADGDVKLTAKTGSVRDLTETAIEANKLDITAIRFQIWSQAAETHLTVQEGDFEVDDVVYISEELVELRSPKRGTVRYLTANDITIEATRGTVNTAAGVIIPGNNVRISAQKIGSYDNPVGINANTTYINRIMGNIDVTEMWGLGTTLCIRGPAPSDDPDSWGAVRYNSNSQLVLEAAKVTSISNDPVYFYGDITFHNFECVVPGKKIYFEAGKTYTFRDSLTITGENSGTKLVELLSQEKGSLWYICIDTNDYILSYIGVGNSYNTTNFDIIAHPKSDFGGNTGWAHNDSVYWIEDTSGNWSDTANWNTSSLPTTGDDVYFTVDHNGDSVIDATWSSSEGTIDSITINGYTGEITQTGAITLNANFSQNSGTWTGGSVAMSVGGNFTLSGGAFTATSDTLSIGGDWDHTDGIFYHNSGTVDFNGSGTQSIGFGPDPFYNLTHSGTSTVTLDTSWSYERVITIAYGITAENLTDFPLLIAITDDSDLYTYAQTNGEDIVFTDSDGTRLPYEIEYYSRNAGAGTVTAYIWVKIASLSSTEDTVLHMYYGNASAAAPAADSTYGSQNVWNSGYKGIWHMGDASSPATDSTSNGYDAAGTAVYGATGEIDSAIDFNGSSHYLTSSTINLSGSAITMSAWINADSFQSAWPYISTIAGAEEPADTALLRIGDGGLANNKVQFVLYFGSGQVKLDGITGLSADTWYYVTATYDGSNMRIYINGSQDNSSAQTGSFTSNETFYIDYSNGGRYLDGTIDEVRVSTVARSDDWIGAEYNNQHTTDTYQDISAQSATTLNIAGNLTQSGSGIFSGGTNDISVTGNVNISAGAFTSTSGTLSIAGNWLKSGGSFTHNSGTATFNATDTGHTITTGGSSFYDLVFNGTGGEWAVLDAMISAGDLTISAGTLSGTASVTVNGGNVTGDGLINMTGGTFLVDGTGTFGGATDWTFYNLTFGDGTGAATTSKTGANKITISDVLTISLNQSLAAGTDTWNLSWSGSSLTDVIKIASGGYHNVALMSDGTVYAWGLNDVGQLGDGTTTTRTAPIQVSGLETVTEIAAGENHTVALKSNGTVYAWGYNSSGQLGDGTTTIRSTPVQVLGVGGVGTLTDVTQIAAGAYFTVAVKSSDTVCAWGQNNYGQLGDGTTTERHTSCAS